MTRKPNAKVTPEQVREIRASKEPGTILAARYRITKTAVSYIRKFKTWRDA